MRLNNLSLKYQRFTPLGSKVIGITKFEFVAKTQFLWNVYVNWAKLLNLPMAYKNVVPTKYCKFSTIYLFLKILNV